MFCSENMSEQLFTKVDYSEIDEILQRWSETHRIPMMKEYKEVEVRSFDFVGEDGIRYQLWVDPPNENGSIAIHVWDYKKRRKDLIAKRTELFENLEIAYRAIQAAKSL